jgi:general secretion pathway protein A
LNGSGTEQSRSPSGYEGFYGLAQSPFSLSPDPRFLYLSASHDKAIQQILKAIARKEAFIVLTGDIGTGKTTTCRAVVEQLDKTVCASLVLNPFLAVEDLLRQVLVDLGVVSRDSAHSERFAKATKHELTTTLQNFLRSLVHIRGSTVLLIDEAQHLSPRLLEELRVIASLGSGNGNDRYLQIVLVGQPALLDVLAGPDLRQLDQRISQRARLHPLELEDVEPYVANRLAVAGESVSVVFEPAAINRLHALSGGVPRVINVLADRALTAGAERGVHEITAELVDRAHDAVSFRRRPARPERRSRTLVRTTAVLAPLGILASMALAAPMHRLVSAPLPPVPDASFEQPPLPPPPVSEEILNLLTAPPMASGEIPDDFVAPK